MFKYQPIAEGTALQTVQSYDAMTGVSQPGDEQIVTKGYVVTILNHLHPIGVVFQTAICGKQWVAIDRYGHFWSSFGNTREHAAQWLLKRARA